MNILTQAQFDILKNCDNNYVAVIAKKADITYSHVSNVLQFFEEKKLITWSRKGRIKTVAFTKKGREVSKLYEKIVELLQ